MAGNFEVKYDFGRNKGSVAEEQMVGVDTGFALIDDNNDLSMAEVMNGIRDDRTDRSGFVFAVYHAASASLPETPVAVLEAADAVFMSEGRLGMGLSTMVALAHDLNPEAVLATPTLRGFAHEPTLNVEGRTNQ